MKTPISMKPARALLFAAAPALMLLAAAPAKAEVKPHVAVPDRSGTLLGCWSADRHLYGPYQLRFCMHDNGYGTYEVVGGSWGGRLECRGNVYWHQYGNKLSVQMTRSHCGNNTDWTADSFSCQVPYGDLRQIAQRNGGSEPRIMVPERTPSHRLSCTYRPSVDGYWPTWFRAVRPYTSG
jgi:hypothetical protein